MNYNNCSFPQALLNLGFLRQRVNAFVNHHAMRWCIDQLTIMIIDSSDHTCVQADRQLKFDVKRREKIQMDTNKKYNLIGEQVNRERPLCHIVLTQEIIF